MLSVVCAGRAALLAAVPAAIVATDGVWGEEEKDEEPTINSEENDHEGADDFEADDSDDVECRMSKQKMIISSLLLGR